jgi:YjbE family integral membrane protein
MTLPFLLSIFQIILIDIVLSGDNAVVIAMAAHKLPAYQRGRAIMWGGGIAIFMRIVFTMIMAYLLMVPGLRMLGGLVLVWIACKLLRDEHEQEVTPDNADQSTLAAIRMIFLADFVMSLDNMLAVAGASHGNWKMLLMGLLVSIGIIMTCSAMIARLMNRYHWIVTLGAAILAFTAGEMMLGDRELASYFVRNHQVVLDRHWEDFAESHTHLSDFQNEAPLPDSLRDVASWHSDSTTSERGTLTFSGQMSPAQRDALLALTADKVAVDLLYESTRHHEVPNWVPESSRQSVEPWFQLKWPAEQWSPARNNRHHYVSWIFCGMVIALCLTSPRWWPGPRKHDSTVDAGVTVNPQP